MQMSDTRDIQAPPSQVYAALLDPDVLKACVGGAQEVTGNPTDGYHAVVVQKVGPVKATFKGTVTMSDMVEPERLTISGEGKGGGPRDLPKVAPRWCWRPRIRVALCSAMTWTPRSAANWPSWAVA